ncbi:hypothetical protein D3C76_1034050 [compost metagenome]
MLRAGTANAHGLDLALGQGLFRLAIEHARPRYRTQVAQGDVGADRLRQQQALAFAVFGDQRDTGLHGSLGRVDGDHLRWLAEGNAAAVGTVGAVDQAQQFGTAGTDQAGDAEDLPCPDLERHFTHLVGTAELVDLEQRRADLPAAQVDMLAQLAADHQVDQFGAAVALYGFVAHQLAVAQHDDALGHALQFFQAM